MLDLTTLTDEQLDDHRRAVLIEQERRTNLAAIPEQIAALARTYRDGGGDEQALTDAHILHALNTIQRAETEENA